MAKNNPDPAVIASLSSAVGNFQVEMGGERTLDQTRQALLDAGVSQEFIDQYYPDQAATAVNAAVSAEKGSARMRRLQSILENANIDFSNPLTQDFLASITQGASGEDGAAAALAILDGPGGGQALSYFLEHNPDAAITRPTPYSVALEDNAFQPSPLEGLHRIAPRVAEAQPDYETSTETGAIKFPNGVIVTSDNGIIFDPTKDAPGSSSYLREAANWDDAKLAEWKNRLVTYGYLSKDQAKGEGFSVEMRQALETYWHNYYIAGGKPIAASSTPGGGGPTQAPPLDYSDFSAQIQNDTRDQLRRVLGVEPTEEQVRAQAQYIMHTATDLQKKFRGKDYGSPGSMALTEATESAIGNIETSPYAQDVRENTQLRDSLANAASVTRGLLT